MAEMVLEPLHKSESPHLRLFLSADIVGSTAFKQNASALQAQEQSATHSHVNRSPFPSWFTIVLQFYQQAEQSFAMQWQEISTQNTSGDGDDFFGDPPELWKTIGDEVLFSKRIDHPWQAVVCMHAWVATIEGLRGFLTDNKLNVKSTAWLADFPLRNNEIVLRKVTTSTLQDADDTYILNNQNALRDYYETNSSGYIRDFIGPSIDTGFRITQFASVRKLAISIELAYLLSCEQVRATKEPKLYARGNYVLPSFTLKYDGQQHLKGVLNGQAYPIFWIDLDPNNPLSLAEDKVTNNPKPSAPDIFHLADTFIESQPRPAGQLGARPSHMTKSKFLELTRQRGERQAVALARNQDVR
ncbi:hypothetical protein [Duganella sp.]|uniref:hypothetical protein n=1 Tax=Duganella sp. TaxID=1904440 RepID=UPI0031D7554B